MDKLVINETLSDPVPYPVAIRTYNYLDTIHGLILNVTEKELLMADDYEGPDYKRIIERTSSGMNVWIYTSL